VRVVRLERRPVRFPVLDAGEIVRQQFEDLLEARDPDEPSEPAAA
jgi:hypothetical protein